MADEPDQARLKALEERLAKLKAQTDTPRKAGSTGTGFSQGEVAWRMVLELATGIGLGAAIGYGIDTLAGTLPIFLSLFTLLGFAAGVKTMLGSAKQLTQAAEAAERNKAAPAAKDEGE